MARLDDVELFIEDEDENHTVDATEYAVELGEPFADHVSKKPSEFTLTGYILSNDWESDKDKLKTIMDAGKIIKYVGRMTASNVIILKIGGKHSAKVSNGMGISITLRRVRITVSAWQKVPPIQKPAQKPPTSGGNKKPVPAKPTTATTSTAQYHVIKKGDTYWGLSGKYGTSISQLRSWNGWADTKIPIGAKARVK